MLEKLMGNDISDNTDISVIISNYELIVAESSRYKSKSILESNHWNGGKIINTTM